MIAREQIELTLEDQRVVVDPTGGGLRAYEAAGSAVLDAYPAGEPSPSGRGQVLIPWPNRLEDGSYEFDGVRHQLELTEPEHRNAIHGLVRTEPWTVGTREASRVLMEHTLEPQPGYPFSLALSIEYALGTDGLTVRTTAGNTGAEACPYGAGAHPYLTVGTEPVDSASLRVPARNVLRANDRGLPVGQGSVEGTDYDFRRPRPIGATVLDHAFTGLERGEDGRALVELAGERSVSLWVDETYPYLMVFTGDPLPDVARRSLAVEPMTCPPNAFRTGTDLVRLEPGESFTSVWGIRPS
jgi:galactose mutarotase-like enzyme